MQSKYNAKFKSITGFLTLAVYFTLALSTLLVFWQVRNFDFINYDDDLYVFENQQVLNGLTWEGCKSAFTTAPAGGNWLPMTWLSLMLDSQLSGPELNPGLFHLVSVFLHIANTLLLFAVLKKMTGSLWPSAFVAAAFALHPLHVESVAWVTERKDVLSTFFMLLTLAAYTAYVKRPSVYRYMLPLVLFSLGLMSKPMLVTLPFVLLLLDYWPLERMKFGISGKTSDGKKWFPLPKLILEKIPLFILSIASSVIAFLTQRSGGSMKGVEVFSIKARAFNAAVSYFEYIKNMFWPADLAVFYPHPGENISTAKAVACIILLVGLTAVVLYHGRRRKYFAAGWLWYLGTLVPVIGLVQVGDQSMADRYTYIPLIGLLIIIAWAVPELLLKWPYRKIILSMAMITVLAALGICAHRQVSSWKNSLSLFLHAVDVTQNNYMAYNNLGNAYGNLGRYEQEIKAYQQAIRIKPDYAHAYNNLAAAFGGLGLYQEGVKASEQAIRIQPDYPEAYYNLGNNYNNIGLFQEALDAFKQAVILKPGYPDPYLGLGIVYLNIDDKASAMEQYKILKTLNPEMAEELLNLIKK